MVIKSDVSAMAAECMERQFDKEEVSKVNLFFNQLMAVDPNYYSSQYKTKEQKRLARRQFADEILSLTNTQFMNGFQRLSKLRQTGDRDSMFPKPEMVIGLAKGVWKTGEQKPPAGAYSYADTTPAITRDRSALAISAHGEAMNELESMLDD